MFDEIMGEGKLGFKRWWEREIKYHWVVLILLLGVMVAGLRQQNRFTSLASRMGVTGKPGDYWALAEAAVDSGDYRLAQYLYDQGAKAGGNAEQVLGWWSALWEKIFPEKSLRQKIQSWEVIIDEQPTYRDGLLTMTILYWRLGDKAKAQEYFNRAMVIDPNHQRVQMVKQLLGK